MWLSVTAFWEVILGLWGEGLATLTACNPCAPGQGSAICCSYRVIWGAIPQDSTWGP